MSHRAEIYNLVAVRWKSNLKLADTYFCIGKIKIDSAMPKTCFFQRLGGTLGYTTTKAYMEEANYGFESYARTFQQIDDLVEEIEETFDRYVFSVEGKAVVWMNRTAPTLVEEVGPEVYRSFAMYNVRTNLERR